MNTTLLRKSAFNLTQNNGKRRAGADVDVHVAAAAEELRSKLAQQCWPPLRRAAPHEAVGGEKEREKKAEEARPKAPGVDDADQPRPGAAFLTDVRKILDLDPDELEGEANGDRVRLRTLLQQAELWGLLLSVRGQLSEFDTSFNAGVLLAIDEVVEYIFADAVFRVGTRDPSAIAAHIVDSAKEGRLDTFEEIVAVDAAQRLVASERIEVGDETKFEKHVRDRLLRYGIPFERNAFAARVRPGALLYARSSTALESVFAATEPVWPPVTGAELELLVRYFERNRLENIAATSQKHLILSALTQSRDAASVSLVGDAHAIAAPDFAVRYHADSAGAIAINRNNVLCAAQLFYVMTLGDELGMFEAADLLLREHLSRKRVDIESAQVLHDLQNYALNGEFPDLFTGRMYKRTSEAERRMFYRQVFDLGQDAESQDVVANPEFEGLWNSLVLEDVRYIEAIGGSENPELYVSREGISQATEALQENLSTHCTGMAKVMTPVMYKELDFLIERIFKSPEIISQLALHNSRSYLKVVERILYEKHGTSVGAALLQRKAEEGHAILESIASHDAAMISDDARFSRFVGRVHSFIKTSEKLEQGRQSFLDQDEQSGAGASNDAELVQDGWNF